MSAFNRKIYYEIGNVCPEDKIYTDLDRCSGCGFSNTSTFQEFFMKDNFCVNQFRKKLYGDLNNEDVTFQTNLIDVETRMNRVFDVTFGSTITNYDPNATNVFQNYLYESVCNYDQLPGVCDNYLRNKLCDGTIRKYSSMETQPATAQFCGCYIKPTNADKLYSGVTISAVTPNKPDPATLDPDIGVFPCYSTCNRSDTVRLYSPYYPGNIYGCNSTTCVIDDILLGVDNTNDVNVNVSQVCPVCSKDNICTCIFSSSDLENNDKVNLSFKSDCGTNSICYLEADGKLTPISCDEFFTKGGKPPNKYQFWTSTAFIIIIVVVLIVFVILFFVGSKYSKEVNVKVNEKRKDSNGNEQEIGKKVSENEETKMGGMSEREQENNQM
jgi:hypothetical protein